MKLFGVGVREAVTEPIRTRNVGDSITVNAGASRNPTGLGRRVNFWVLLGICYDGYKKTLSRTGGYTSLWIPTHCGIQRNTQARQ